MLEQLAREAVAMALGLAPVSLGTEVSRCSPVLQAGVIRRH